MRGGDVRPRHISKCKTRDINSNPSDVEQVYGMHLLFSVNGNVGEVYMCTEAQMFCEDGAYLLKHKSSAFRNLIHWSLAYMCMYACAYAY
jgi:hypothetical protein